MASPEEHYPNESPTQGENPGTEKSSSDIGKYVVNSTALNTVSTGAGLAALGATGPAIAVYSAAAAVTGAIGGALYGKFKEPLKTLYTSADGIARETCELGVELFKAPGKIFSGLSQSLEKIVNKEQPQEQAQPAH